MIIPVNVTLEQLRGMTKAQIHTKAIKHYKDGRQPTVTEG